MNICLSIRAILCAGLLLPMQGAAADNEEANIEKIVAAAVRPLMEQHAVPGMAVGVLLDGHTYLCNYGVASKATGKAIDDHTLFEIGSVSKTFVATLACYAQLTGQLSLSDPASRYLPGLRGSSFDGISLLNLGTHTSGGLQLQVPDEVTNRDQLMQYFRGWQPTYAPGTYRTYSNLSIGLLGIIAARSMHEDFSALMIKGLYPALGLKSTYLNVPANRMVDYAQGYTEADQPTRVSLRVLGTETYGVRTTAGDLARWVAAGMNLGTLDEKWQRAIAATHTGYYQIGPMTQDLIWEQYPSSAGLSDLLAGNSTDVILKPNPAAKLDPVSPPREDVLINKTGSTNGFSTYVLFIPAKKVGVVLLANKRFPIDARVTTGYEILTRVLNATSGK